MKFSVLRDDIHAAVNTVQRATATRVIQPILSNILIESTGADRLKLAATDLDLAIETSISATVVAQGKTTLSAKKLSEIINRLPNGSQITFEIDEQLQSARIECGKSVFDMRTLPAEEFPLIKQIDQAQYLDVSQKALVKAVNQTVFAAASYDANNVLGGVYFQLNGNGLEMAATDGSRLARRLEPVAVEALNGANNAEAVINQDITAIIPAKALQEFLKLAGSGDSEAPVRLAIQDGQIAFRSERFYLLSRLLDGQYPKYHQLIPAENKYVIYAKKQEFISSIERAAVMANERTNIVKMQFADGNASLAAQTPDVGDASDNLSVTYDGEPLSIAFNYKFVLDALKVIESDDVRLETNGSLSPTLFRSKEENDYLCLVMPVQVK
ncbi:MAG: DNA polymerase III subunit beta [Vampirovibrionales bacterium]|nr:DNA polymerase III subunit beta [Vampirovibrionales bacterium]